MTPRQGATRAGRPFLQGADRQPHGGDLLPRPGAAHHVLEPRRRAPHGLSRRGGARPVLRGRPAPAHGSGRQAPLQRRLPDGSLDARRPRKGRGAVPAPQERASRADHGARDPDPGDHRRDRRRRRGLQRHLRAGSRGGADPGAGGPLPDRPAHRRREPPLLGDPAQLAARREEALRAAGGTPLPGPGPVQERQRPVRSRGGRRRAPGRREDALERPEGGRLPRPLGRRGVHRARRRARRAPPRGGRPASCARSSHAPACRRSRASKSPSRSA